MNIRKSLTVLMLSLFNSSVFPAVQKANPYDLFGEGNCAYFCWDMMDRFGLKCFPSSVSGTLKTGIKLGPKRGEYTADLIQLDDIKPGDFIIFPYSSNMPRDAFILCWV